MKCPNCNNEALYVNGKYVCVDCGIEITPEQQAAQMESDSFDSVLGDGLASVKKDTDAPDTGADPQQTTTPKTDSPEEKPTEPPSAQTSDKPVEEYYKSQLASDEPAPAESTSPAGGSGVYDFSNKPTSQPIDQQANQPAAQPTEEPSLNQPADQPMNQPAEKTIDQFEKPVSDQPIGQPANKTADEPVKGFSSQPAERPIEEPTVQPPEESVPAQPENKPTEQPPEQPAEQPASGPISQPAEQPPVQLTEQPADQPSEKPTLDQPIEKPADQPSDQPAEQLPIQPAEQPPNKPQETESQPTDESTPEPSFQAEVNPQAPEPSLPKEFPSSAPPEDSEKKDSLSEQPPVADEGQPQEYFSPNTFNLGGEAESRDQAGADESHQSADKPDDVQEPEGAPDASLDSYPVPSEAERTGEPTIDDLQAQGQEKESESPEPKGPTQDASEGTESSETDSGPEPGDKDEASEGFSEPKGLDEMLDESEKRPSSEGANASEAKNVDGFSQPHKKDSQGNIPSVESVFGDGGSDSETPTPQDFGLPAPDPKADSKKKMIKIGAIAGGLLLVIVVLLFVFLGRGRGPYPIQLSEENITALSSKVSEAMDKPQDMTVSYEVRADFPELISDIIEEPAAEGTVEGKDEEIDDTEASYRASGLWLLDEEGNVYLSKDVDGKSIKQSFIESENTTYTYNEKDDKWKGREEYQISAIPPFIDPQNKSSIIYASSIDQALLAGVEYIDGIEVRVYEIKPQRDFVKNLEFMGGIFSDADYVSTDASKLTFEISVGTEDSRIYRTDLSGDLMVESGNFSGSLSLAASAEYEYKKVLIRKPRETAGVDPPYLVTIDEYKEEEEVEASSVNNRVVVGNTPKEKPAIYIGGVKIKNES